MINILHVMSSADQGGVASVVLNYYSHIDRTRFHFDVALTTDAFSYTGEKLTELGVRFYRLPMKSVDRKGYWDGLCRILRENHYDAIHVHENMTSFYALMAARRCGVKIRIAHSHTSAPVHSIKEELARRLGCALNSIFATELLACGELAGRRVFGSFAMKTKRGHVLPNAVDPEQFRFRETDRESIRARNDDEKSFVIGLVGRLEEEKNPMFALQIVREAMKTIPEIRLYIVGYGSLEERIRQQIAEDGLDEHVLCLGRQKNVGPLYSSFDALIMPSLHEGYPVAAVEAVANGLPVLLSDRITRELKEFEGISYLPLTSCGKWVEKLREIRNTGARSLGAESFQGSKMDIKCSAHILECIYSGKEER